MIIPSIQLNVFKKLGYFLILKRLDKQFDSQLSALKSRDFDCAKWRFKNSAYPVWEIEKKVLFWTYGGHKFLGHNIKESHLNESMLISEQEYKNVGIENVFGNLEQRKFGKTGNNKTECTITPEGLSFGELIWFLYKSKEYQFSNKQIPDNYTDIYKTKHILKKSLGWYILQAELFSIYILIVYAVGSFTLEILNLVGLLDNFRNYIKLLSIPSWTIIIILLSPFVVFTISFIFDFIYKIFVVDKKYQKIKKDGTQEISN